MPDRKPQGFISTGKENRDVDTMLQAFCATDQQLDLNIAPTNGSVNYQQIIEKLLALPDSVRVHYTDGVILILSGTDKWHEKAVLSSAAWIFLIP